MLQTTDADGNKKALAAFCDFSLKVDNPNFETVLGTAVFEETIPKPIRSILTGHGDVKSDDAITFTRQELGAQYTTMSGFTAPQGGKYLITFSGHAKNYYTQLDVLVDYVKVTSVYDQLYSSGSSNYRIFSATIILDLSLGSVVSLKCQCSGDRYGRSSVCFGKSRLLEAQLVE